MIMIEFRINEENLAEDLQHFSERTDSAALEETYFVMPIRLCANGVELFQLPNHKKRNIFIAHPDKSAEIVRFPEAENCWLPLPLLGFASHALQKLNEIKPGGEQKMYLAGNGHLLFARHGRQLSITSSINNKVSLVQFDEVQNAFRGFSAKVQQLLVSRVPAIQQHPSWNQWFSL